MAYFERVSTLVQAWRLPMMGEQADETAPAWLIDRFISGEITINMLGGVNYTTDHGITSCIAGDFVLLTEDGNIEFCKATEFNHRYKLLEESLAA